MRLTKEHRYFLDVALFITGSLCLVSGFLLEGHRTLGLFGATVNLRSLHTLTGYLMACIILLHLLLHAGWIRCTTQEVFRDRKKLSLFVLVVLATLMACYLPLKLGFSPSREGARWQGPPAGYGPPRR